MDFTLTLSDEVVSHVLAEIARGHHWQQASQHHQPSSASEGQRHSAGAIRRFQRPATPASPSVLMAAIPRVEHETIAEPDVGGASDDSGARDVTDDKYASAAASSSTSRNRPAAAAPHSSHGQFSLQEVDPAVRQHLHDMAVTALGRLRSGYFAGELAPQPQWRPFAEQARRYPWLRSFTKLAVVEEGLDAEAVEMGLSGASMSAPS